MKSILASGRRAMMLILAITAEQNEHLGLGIWRRWNKNHQIIGKGYK